MANNLMICANTKNALHINESEVAPGKKHYILEGVFAELDTLNRNQRIYPKEEYLKHLQYLRNDIKRGEPLLGELDHPEDRFEVKLKDASHRVIDLWYDAAKNVVMGKIELLNTPNGLLAQSIIDQGIPLHISSRAAGTVNKDNTVSIQQIYTYDLVCKPGFANAVLHRVDESAGDKVYSTGVKSFLTNMLKTESMNSAPQYGIVNENVSVSEIKAPAVLRKEAKEIQINKQIEINEEDMTKPLNLNEDTNADATVGKLLSLDNGEDSAAALGSHAASEDLAANNAVNADSADKQREDAKDEEPKKDKKKDGEKPDSSSEVKGVEIIDVTPEFEENDNDDKDSVKIKDVEAYSKDDDSDKDSDKKEDEEPKKDDTSEEKSECSGAKCAKDASTDDIEALYDEKDGATTKKDEIEKQKEEFNSKFDKLIAAIEKKNKQKDEAKCESVIMARYPVTMMMNESNFAQFAALNESEKTRVIAYLQNANAVTSKAINESWKNGLTYVEEEPVWLKYAPATYKQLYESALPKVKENLATSAKYFIFESQADVDTFWENSGLAEAQANRLLNESFINNMPKIAAAPVQTGLPYSTTFIMQIADMASEYNR